MQSLVVQILVMKQFGVDRVSNRDVLKHEQFVIAKNLDLGSPRLENIEFVTSNMCGDRGFEDLINEIRQELRDSNS